MTRGALPRERRVQRQFWEKLTAGEPGDSPCLLDARYDGLEVLIMIHRVGFEAVQDWVVENLPPFALGNRIAGFAGLPAPVGGGEIRDFRLLVVRTDRTGGEEEGEDTVARKLF